MNGTFLEMKQLDLKKVALFYSDGMVKKLLLSTVQKNCACSRCKGKEPLLKEDVIVSKITSVGRYGLKFHFLSGCQQGIFSHRQLREIPCDI
ncbi:MAG: DUF971 domain-containing protein [Chlamydiae bacterium]|nr:DUF971 domain-containing protein [Chlamydiota bacterium]